MKKVMFVKPAIEIDAVFDPVRTTSYLGMWYLASLLKQKGHDVRYLDEVVRNGGLKKRDLFRRVIEGNQIVNLPEEMTFEEFERQKMDDFRKLTPHDFIKKYGAFRAEGRIQRMMARVGNPLEKTLAEIEKMKPDIVGIPLIASANYSPAVELGEAIKERFPDTKVIYGGQHITAGCDRCYRRRRRREGKTEGGGRRS
jgi:hypothetical protein